jgi:hypothetical protein
VLRLRRAHLSIVSKRPGRLARRQRGSAAASASAEGKADCCVATSASFGCAARTFFVPPLAPLASASARARAWRRTAAATARVRACVRELPQRAARRSCGACVTSAPPPQGRRRTPPRARCCSAAPAQARAARVVLVCVRRGPAAARRSASRFLKRALRRRRAAGAPLHAPAGHGESAAAGAGGRASGGACEQRADLASAAAGAALTRERALAPQDVAAGAVPSWAALPYAGTSDALTKVLRSEGVAGFYR